MDLRQLRYFLAVATQQHFGRAASALHVAQPALTRHIHLLESELGVQLFVRHARGATPTEEALYLLERASFIVRYMEQTKQDLIARQRTPQGSVSIGMSPWLALLLGVTLTQAVRQQLPEVQLRFVEEFAPTLRTTLLQGGVDLAVLNGPVQTSNLVTYPLLSEDLCVIARTDDRRISGPRIDVRQLAGIPLVMTGLAKSGVRLELEVAAGKAGVELQQVVEVETIEVAKRMVLEGLGVTVHFAAAVQDGMDASRLSAYPINGLHLRRILALAADRPPSRATEELVGIVRTVIAQAVHTGRWPNTALNF